MFNDREASKSTATGDHPEWAAVFRSELNRELAPGEPSRHIVAPYKGKKPTDWMKDKPAGVFEYPSETPGKDTWFRGSLDDLFRLKEAEAERARKVWGDGVKLCIGAMTCPCKEGIEGRIFIARPEDESKSAGG